MNNFRVILNSGLHFNNFPSETIFFLNLNPRVAYRYPVLLCEYFSLSILNSILISCLSVLREDLEKEYFETKLPARLEKFDALLKGPFFLGDKVRHATVYFQAEHRMYPEGNPMKNAPKRIAVWANSHVVVRSNE